MALEIEKIEAVEAKKRQGTRTDVGERFPQSSEAARSKDIAADRVGANPHYVTDAKRIAREARPLELSPHTQER